MRNLTPYTKKSFDFFCSVVSTKKNSKQDPDYKNRVSNYKEFVQDKFEKYDSTFEKNSLVDLDNSEIEGVPKKDLLKLYSYKNSKIQKLKIDVTTLENSRLINTCQNCTISEVNTFDHFVDKDSFPEFSVHPKNLFPSCSVCNSLKGSVWKKEGEMLFLNLYLDQLPLIQYLYVEINISNNVIDTNYYLKSNSEIEHAFFKRLENHYRKLNLFNRFKINSHDIITSLEYCIQEQIKKISLKDCIEVIEESCKAEMKYFGRNYWPLILKMELISNNEFLSKF